MHEAAFLQQQLRLNAQHRVSATECIECEEPIPELRREHVKGVQLCVDCQGRKE